MNVMIEANREKLADLCRQFCVRRLEAFGSVVRSDFGPKSDVDLLVEFERGEKKDAFEQYFGFKEAVEQMVGREVDLIVADAVRNPIFKAELQRTKAPVYVAA